jgi:hypothetical protein
MQSTYKSLDKLVRDLILSTVSLEEVNLIASQGRAGTASGEAFTDIGLTGLLDALIGDLRQMVKPRIHAGLEITASDPINDQITIASGSGFANGYRQVLNSTVTTVVPFEDDISVYYINLWQGKIDVETTVPENKLNIGKVVIPSPGLTDSVQDDKSEEEEELLNAYIVSAKDLFFDDDVILDDDSRDVLKDALGQIHFEQLIGDLILTENIRVRNESNTLLIDSSSIRVLYEGSNNVSSEFNSRGTFYYNEAGFEVARYTKNDSRMGNILILPNAIQSVNFVTNTSGFRIQDNGDAEFNNIRLRGTLYTSVIAENIYINPGIEFIGDLIFTGDVSLNADQKLIFDNDMGADTYAVYDSASAYFQVWVDGSKRIEL